MPTREPKNLAASVRQKLFGLARARNEDFGLMLVKYGLERILYRLSRSKHRDVFVLKGALLFELWTHRTYRATRDADFLARGDNDPERFVSIFKELCVIDVEPDGLTFDAALSKPSASPRMPTTKVCALPSRHISNERGFPFR